MLESPYKHAVAYMAFFSFSKNDFARKFGLPKKLLLEVSNYLLLPQFLFTKAVLNWF